MKKIREQMKKYIPLGLVVLILFLIIHYWNQIASLLSLLGNALTPILIGAIIAFVVNIIMSSYERTYQKITKGKGQKAKRPICMILAYLTVLLVVILLLVILIPEFVKSISSVQKNVLEWNTKFLKELSKNKYVGDYAREAMDYVQHRMDLDNLMNKLASFVASGATGAFSIVMRSVRSIISLATNLLIGLIFSVYILAEKEKLGRQFAGLIRTYLPRGDQFVKLCVLVDDCFHKFLVAQFTDACILGSLCGIGLAIMRFPYALMTGVLIAATALIPVVGAFLGALLSGFLILTVSPVKALIFLVYIVILQQIDNNLIYPRVVGTSIDLPGIWVLAAVTIGGGLFGAAGMLCGVPLTSAAYKIIKEDYRRRQVKPAGKDRIA